MFERNNQDLRYHERAPDKKKLPPHRAPGDAEVPDDMEPGAVAVSGISKPIGDGTQPPVTADSKEPGAPGTSRKDTSSYETSGQEARKEGR